MLDLGCVMHDPSASLSRYWLHRAIAQSTVEATGMDLDAAGVAALAADGYCVVAGDAEAFTLPSQFDLIVAGDIIEHLGNPGGMLR